VSLSPHPLDPFPRRKSQPDAAPDADATRLAAGLAGDAVLLTRHAGPVPVDYRERFGGAYQRELTEWVDGVLRGEITGPSAWDGYATTAVAEAAVESQVKGGRVAVELAERPALYA